MFNFPRPSHNCNDEYAFSNKMSSKPVLDNVVLTACALIAIYSNKMERFSYDRHMDSKKDYNFDLKLL